MSAGFTIRGWLMVQPRPAALSLHCGPERHTLPIQNGQSWANIARSVDAMQPDLLQALDAEGKILRACKPYEQQTDDDGKPASSASSASAGDDPETARFRLFAQLLAEAYKHATEVAFQKLADITDIMGRRGESLERSLASTERLLHKAWQENVEIQAEAAENQSPLERMAASFVGGLEHGGQANGQANGKGGAT